MLLLLIFSVNQTKGIDPRVWRAFYALSSIDFFPSPVLFCPFQ
jgi:hypothetical protein